MSGTEHVNQNKLTVWLPEFECQYCVNQSTNRASYEDGEWVHYDCGMPVNEDDAEEADERLSHGEGKHKYPEADVEQIADGIAGALADRSQDTDTDEEGDR